MNSVPIFISYAMEDQVASQAIQRQLVIMRRKKIIAFNDQHLLNITTADRWDSIKAALNQSPIILLMLSDFFIASDECYEIQEQALVRAQAGQAILIPVLFKQCSWQDLDGVSRLQPLPRSRVFINDWPDSDNAFAEIAREIGTLAQQIFEGKLTLEQSAPEVEEKTNGAEEENLESSDPRKLIAQGQLGKALEVLALKTKTNADINGQILALQSRWSTLNAKIRAGTISTADEQLQRNQIVAAILDTINDM